MLGGGAQVQTFQPDKQTLPYLPSAPASISAPNLCEWILVLDRAPRPLGGLLCSPWQGQVLSFAPPLSQLPTVKQNKINWRPGLKILQADKTLLSHGSETKSSLFYEHKRNLTEIISGGCP